MSLSDLQLKLKQAGSKKRAEVSQNFFKTGKGEYGEGDIFLGITVPELRKIARKYTNLSLVALKKLLESKIHEYRYVALLILVEQYKRARKLGAAKVKNEIVEFYLKNAEYVNNWDLVDTSAPYILGDYLLDRSRKVLYTFARSKNLWKNRISIVATYHFIKHDDFTDTLDISTILLSHSHDLIHKAVGWMLREVGKRDKELLEDYLIKNISTLPRTTLRYAIEKFSTERRKYYLSL